MQKLNTHTFAKLLSTYIVQILNKADCISHSTNTPGKGINPIILPSAMGKLEGRLGSSALAR